MSKKIGVVAILVCLAAFFLPTVSYAAVTPYFMAVNNTLLPFNNDTMPIIVNGEFYVPPGVFSGVSVWSTASVETEYIRIYRGISKHVDFFIASGATQDQDGKALPWPPARREGNRFYVPLIQVCEHFGLDWEIIEINRDVIPQEQMYIIRIISGDVINKQTFIGLNKNTIKASYNEYFAPPPTSAPPSASPTPAPPGVTDTPPPVIEEPPPTYGDVTIYLSFYDISSSGADTLTKILDANTSLGYRFCFFVNVSDINEDPGLIRRIAGSGHTIGIWLENASYEEYLETSELLFEAAKVKTVLVSADEVSDDAKAEANAHGLVLWGASQSLVYNDTLAVEDVTAMISQESGARQNLISPCSRNAAFMLTRIISFLHEYEYSVVSINETVEPV